MKLNDLSLNRSSVAQKLSEMRNVKPLSEEQIKSELSGINMPKVVDAVFEGGGVKGIALSGAIQVCEVMGVKWGKLAGTSAGAITASLVAAGYSANELIDIMINKLNFKDFVDSNSNNKFFNLISVLVHFGLNKGEYFEEWITEMLANKNVDTFEDLKNSNEEIILKVLASDVSNGQFMILPDSLTGYPGTDINEFKVSHAVRMSMSIPIFFNPVKLLNKWLVVDGGLLSNFPVWIFDVKDRVPERPTIGFRLVEPDSKTKNNTLGIVSYLKSILSTLLEAHDEKYISEANFSRTIAIPTMGVKTTEFDITTEKKFLLLRSGQEAAIKFFKNFDFNEHNQKYRIKGE